VVSDIASKLWRSSLWVVGARVLVNLLGLLSTFVLAWVLTPGDFGIVALGSTLLAIVSSFTELSLSQALVRHDDPQDPHYGTAFTLNLLRGVALAAVFVAISYGAARYYGDPRLFAVMTAMSASFVIGGLVNPKQVVLQRQLLFWQEFVQAVSQKLIGFVVGVALAVIFRSYWALVISSLASQVTAVAVSYMVYPYRPRFTFRHSRELLGFSFWITAGQLVSTLNWRFDFLLVGKVLGNTALGHYSVAGNLALIPTHEATYPLTRTLYPAMSAIRGDAARLAAGYQRAQALVTAIALPAGFGVAAISEPLIALAMGPKWAPIVPILAVLSIVFAVQTIGSLAQPLGTALGQVRTLFVRDVQMLVLQIPVILVGAVWFGLPGLIAARSITGAIFIAANTMLVRRFTGLGLWEQMRLNIRPLVAASVMAATVLALTRAVGPYDTVPLRIAALALFCLVGGVVHIGVTALLWMLAGRPAGPESEIIRFARANRVVQRLLGGRARAAATG